MIALRAQLSEKRKNIRVAADTNEYFVYFSVVTRHNDKRMRFAGEVGNRQPVSCPFIKATNKTCKLAAADGLDNRGIGCRIGGYSHKEIPGKLIKNADQGTTRKRGQRTGNEALITKVNNFTAPFRAHGSHSANDDAERCKICKPA